MMHQKRAARKSSKNLCSVLSAAAAAAFVLFSVSIYYLAVTIDRTSQNGSASASMLLRKDESTRRPRDAAGSELASPTGATGGGYLLFCLCMGRYGNQMEQFLGVLGESKRRSPHRILVLPSFISWNYQTRVYIPLEDVFRIEELRRFHPNVIAMNEFLSVATSIPQRASHLGDGNWDPTHATVYCQNLWASPGHVCNDPRHTDPGTYWHSVGINFTSHHYHDGQPLDLDPEQHPIVALNGAPAPFPVRSENSVVAKFLSWTDVMERRVTNFLADAGIDVAAGDSGSIIVAAHLRAGSDWVKACQHAVGKAQYMASPQCSAEMTHKRTGHVLNITQDVCLPTSNMSQLALSLRHIGDKMRKTMNEQEGGRLIIFVASDVPTLGMDLMEKHGLKSTYDLLIGDPSSVGGDERRSSHQQPHGIHDDAPLLDLAMMTRAHYFIGNCVSSFTSFAARMRREQNMGVGTGFFGLV